MGDKRRMAEFWMDRIIAANENLMKIELELYQCISSGKREVFLNRGAFNDLIHDFGAAVTYNPNWCENHPDVGEAYFIYKGYKFFCLWDKKGA